MQKLIFSPLALFVLSAVLSFLVWALLPDTIMLDAGIRQRVSIDIPLIVAGLSILTFGTGWLMGGGARIQPARGMVAPAQIIRIFYSANLIGTVAMTALLANTVLTYGLGGLILTARGFVRPAHIDGVTTWVHLSTLTMAGAIIFRSSMASVSDRRALMKHALWGGGLALTRAVVSGERLAMLIPIVAMLVGLAIITRRQVVMRAFMMFAGLGVALVLIFTASELLRSYRIKKQDGAIDAGALNYSVNRLLLYYASSVNAGSATYEYSQNEAYRQPIFSATANPLAQIVYRLPGSGMLKSSRASMVGYYTLVREGYRPRELTNTWGFASPFIEGPVWGCIYWILWGFMCRILWRQALARPQASWWLVACGVAGAGLLDCGRVLTIGSVHILLPLIIALILAYRSQRRERMQPRGGVLPVRRRA